ncbi:MAG: ABC transporter permease subunit [Defluviitaleaceae bacterium]|nr:ABC transporter permease subunit [Defluviitaleaceae bacterium]
MAIVKSFFILILQLAILSLFIFLLAVFTPISDINIHDSGIFLHVPFVEWMAGLLAEVIAASAVILYTMMLSLATLAVIYLLAIPINIIIAKRKMRVSAFIITAKSKGVPDKKIFTTHILKGAMLPLWKNTGSVFVTIFIAFILIESIFNLPGMGQLFIASMILEDFSAVAAILMLYSAIALFIMFIADAINMIIDPRIRSKANTISSDADMPEDVANTRVWHTLRSNKLALISFILFMVIIVLSCAAAFAIDLSFTSAFLDNDLTEIIWLITSSIWNSFTIAFVIAAAGTVFGTLFGLISGFYGKVIDCISKLILAAFAIILPAMLIAVFVAIMPAITALPFALSAMVLVSWQKTAAKIKAATQQKKALDHVITSKALGTPHIAIMFKEILPNLFLLVAKRFVITLAFVILLETSLTFLGFGLPPTLPSLGRLIYWLL